MANVVVAEDLGPGVEGLDLSLPLVGELSLKNKYLKYGALALAGYFAVQYVKSHGMLRGVPLIGAPRLAGISGLGSYRPRRRRRRRSRR